MAEKTKYNASGMKQNVVVLESNSCEDFENDLNMYVGEGYLVSSTCCGFMNAEYDYASIYQAVLVLAESKA